MADVKNKNSPKKKRNSNKNKVLIALVLSILSVSLFVALSLTVFFKVAEIKVSGSKTYTMEQIMAASGIKIGDNLWLISEEKVNLKISKTLPYIASVRLDKKLPNKVNIVVTETKGYLTVSCNGEYYIADSNGKILEKTDELSDELILMTVSDKTKIACGELISFETDREKELFSLYMDFAEKPEFKVDFINVSDPFDTYVKLENRLVVKLGSSSYFEEKSNYLKASLVEISKDSKGIFDLSTWSPDNNKPIFSHADTSEYKF